MNENIISEMLSIILIVMIFILMVLSVTYLILKMKSIKKNKTKKTENLMTGGTKKAKDKSKETKDNSIMYNKQSVFDFMEFDKIEDNMIVQKKGRRYLMVIECQGVNYDLMSRIEKVSVEEGFQQFLNTLRHPVQIYVQTRTVNLGDSIGTYKGKMKEIEDKYRQMMYEYSGMQNEGIYKQEELDKYFFEITKQKNLMEYGKDIIANTEKISLNKGILNKNYYIIVPYFSEDAVSKDLHIEEIRNIAFSELYTKSQAVIRTLSSCSISGKILTSKELIELLYIAYNRDESETYGVDKAYQANYDDLYSTGKDIYEKKIKALDEEIEKKAIMLANEKVEKAVSRKQKMVNDKEDNLGILVSKMAELILEENKSYVGKEIAEEAIEEIKQDRENEKGGSENEPKKTTRGRKKANK